MARPRTPPQATGAFLFRQPGEASPGGIEIAWEPQPKQTEALLREEFEVLCGGGVAGGKTSTLTAFLIQGNPHLDPNASPVNTSYIHHPRYRGLLIRRNRDDMEDWLSRSKPLYELYGGVYRKADWYFEFPSGAAIRVGHLAEDNAYQKYQGHEYQRMAFDELCQIPEEELYLQLLMRCRSFYPELRQQVMSTANPIGPGLPWVNNRFRRQINPLTNKLYPPGETVSFTFYNPITKRDESLTRVFIFSNIFDNVKFVANNPLYLTRLQSLPDNLRRAYLDGDWDALSGSQFFPNFRPTGPLAAEPPTANHVIESSTIDIKPWFPTWAAMDWGFNHPGVVYFAAYNPEDRRVYVTDEIRARFTGSREWGVAIAKRALPILRALSTVGLPPVFTFFLSQDAFQQRDATKTHAEQIESGIKLILGESACYTIREDDDEATFLNRAESLQSRATIVIRVVPRHQRVAGWQYIRELLEWKPPVNDYVMEEYDRDRAVAILNLPNGTMKYLEYIKSLQAQSLRLPPLPGLLIFRDKCPFLLQCLPGMVYDNDGEDMVKKNAHPETGLGGDDEADALRYLLVAYNETPIRQPFEAWYATRLAAQPDSLFAVGSDISRFHDASKEIYNERERPPATFTMPRRGGRHMREWREWLGSNRRVN